MIIAILEDNVERIDEMKKWLADRMAAYTAFVTDDPCQIVQVIRDHAGEILALSLDHDLYEREPFSVEVTGMKVVDELVQHEPTFPILIHSSNDPDGTAMQRRLAKSGWDVARVRPFDGVEWIRTDWFPALKSAIHRFAIPATVGADDPDD